MERTEILNNIVRTVAPGFSVPEVDFADYFVPVLEKHGEKVCLIDCITGRSLTCSELVKLSTKLASALLRRGAKKGDFVAVHTRSCLDFWVIFLAVVRIGGVIVLARPTLNASELLTQLNDARPTNLIFEDIFYEKVLEVKDKIPFIKEIFVSGKVAAARYVSIESLLDDDGTRFVPQSCEDPGNTPLYITYSSGTTGVPKGVIHSHRSALAGTILFGPNGRPFALESDSVLGIWPASHASGVFLGMFLLNIGATNVLVPSFDVKTVLESIEKYKINRLPCFPTTVQLVLNSPLLEKFDVSSVDTFITGGSACPSAVFDKLIKICQLKDIKILYGMSEGLVSMMDAGSLNYQHTGRPLPLTEVKIADLSTGVTLPVNTEGEIRVKSPFLLLGYLNLPEVTASLYDEDGFLKTGDIGCYDEEGNIHVTDRLKDLVKCMDEQVGPSEVEEVLMQHPAVKLAAVIGIPHEAYGETLRAFVILKHGEKNTSSQELINFVADHLPFFKRLHGGLEFAEHLPTNDIGKYMRREIRQKYLQNLSELRST